MLAPAPEQPLLVFSDLDGTLLDHDNYSYAAAAEVLDQLKQLHIPLVLNTSKTSAEVKAIRQSIGNPHPYIVENGAAIIIPGGYFDAKNEQVVKTGKDIDVIEAVKAFESTFSFQAFYQLSAAEVAGLTGLSEQEAAKAKQRFGTEPLKWNDSEENLVAFEKAMQQRGLACKKGGRFVHVQGNHDKATAMFLLAEHYQRHWQKKPITIALGDSFNDLQMLEQAHHGIVIPGKNGTLKVQSKNCRVAPAHGPSGFNQALGQLLQELLNSA